MKTNTLIWALVLIIVVTLIAIVGLNAVVEGDSMPMLVLIVGLITPAVTAILNLLKSQKTLEVSESTDKKVDSLLNGGLQSRIDHVEEAIIEYQKKTDRRFVTVEKALDEILEKVSK